MYRRNFMAVLPAKDTMCPAAAVCWVIGLCLGIMADRLYGSTLHACFLLAAQRRPMLSTLLCCNVLPFLICAYACSFFSLLSFLICLLRGMLVGAGFSAAAGLYGSAGWLVGALSIFSALFCSALFLWRAMDVPGKSAGLCRSVGVCIGIGSGICVLDWAVIAPFLRQIVIL